LSGYVTLNLLVSYLNDFVVQNIGLKKTQIRISVEKMVNYFNIGGML